tara:strand:+ start:3303 stop:3851 length:549 start_codon:yes stop_codon:yes gene_type:complete
VKNQLRKHLKANLLNKIIYLINKYRFGFLGKNVFFDKNVDFIRFNKNLNVSDNVVFKSGAKISCCNANAKISIGANTTIGYNAFIFSSKSIEIGKDCMVSSFVYIVDSSHGIKKNINMNSQDEIADNISIGDDVWIGQGSTILPGVKIGNGSIVGAGSLVNKSIGENKIYAGNPAKEIGIRS